MGRRWPGVGVRSPPSPGTPAELGICRGKAGLGRLSSSVDLGLVCRWADKASVTITTGWRRPCVPFLFRGFSAAAEGIQLRGASDASVCPPGGKGGFRQLHWERKAGTCQGRWSTVTRGTPPSGRFPRLSPGPACVPAPALTAIGDPHWGSPLRQSFTVFVGFVCLFCR